MHCLWSPKCAIVHELLPGSYPVQPDELAAPRYVPEIAATLCRFHGIPAPVSGVACLTAASVSTPASSIWKGSWCGFRHLHMQGKQHVRTPFGRIYEWLDVAEQFTFEDEAVNPLRSTCASALPLPLWLLAAT